jgi:hypothetical protein
VNGWNVVRDNNSGKTLGLGSVNTFSKGSWANNYMTGPENDGTSRGWRNFYDTVLNLTLNNRVSAYLNLDAGRNRGPGTEPAAVFWGTAAALHVTLTERLSITPRAEYYNDCDGLWTGAPHHFNEYTLTGEWKWNRSVLTRLEYRADHASAPFFDVGPNAAHSQNQRLLVVGMVFLIQPGSWRD